jgi:hypothetical protein
MLKRSFALAAMALGLSLTAGCGSDPDPDFGQLFFTWEVETVDGTPTACLADEFVRVTVAGFVEEFPCADESATTDIMPEGLFTARFELVSRVDGVESVVTLPVDIGDGDVTDVGHVVFTVEP